MKISGVEITHPEKIIFPDAHITKLEMVQYYQQNAKLMLPHLKDRPLTLHRFPDGIDKEGFYQKNVADYFPDFIKTIKIKTKEGENIQILCNSEKALIYLANQGTIGFHIWLSKKDKLYKPDKVVFDLDPPKGSFEKVKEAAQITGDFLRNKGLDPMIMATGQSGFHVWYKIQRRNTFDELRPKLKEMAQKLEDENSELFTTAVRKNKRDGKIFIDYLRNAYAQTSVCPYSLRPNRHGSIAMPIDWADLKNIKSADQYNLKDSFRRNNV